MIRTRIPRRRLAAAVTAVLAVTAGTAVGMVPATAASPAAAVSAVSAAPAGVSDTISFPAPSQIISAGPSGFLTSVLRTGWPQGNDYFWTSTVDGTTTELPEWSSGWRGGASDTVVAKEDGKTRYLLQDMTQPGSAPAVIEQPDTRLVWQGAVGRTLVFSHYDGATQKSQLRLIGEGNQPGSDRQVTGLPADFGLMDIEVLSDSKLLVRYDTAGEGPKERYYLAVVDVATAAVVEKREVGAGPSAQDATLSGDRWVWVDAATNADTKLKYAARDGSEASPATELVDLGNAIRTHVGLLGDWVTYAAPDGNTATGVSPHHALTAVNVVDKSTVKLLDHASSSVPAADGALLVRGGSVAHGEGIYRVALGADGKPAATLVAGTGEPTALTLYTAATPPVIDLDKNNGQTRLRWVLSRTNAQGSVTVRHVPTGRTMRHDFSQAVPFEGKASVEFLWDGLLPNAEGVKEFASSGDYAWEFVASPLNGIGPDLKQSGTFKVTRTAGAHDYTDNGSPDLLSRDAAGVLWREDSIKTATSGEPVTTGQVRIGPGWQIYNQLEAVGSVAGSTAGDLVARDKDGILWLYVAKGDGTFAARTKIGAGWNGYTSLAGGGDLNGDGRADLVATDTAGDLYLYKGTGDAAAPFAPRTKIGWGWDIYNQLTATGDIAGTAAGDLVARDKSGVLWLYEGKGDGTFAARTKIGAGWGAFTHLVGVGDADRDGRADLYAVGASGPRFYAGTGNTAAPFKPAANGYLHTTQAPTVF
ncbi:FG-GAP repeat domain-containing protein [Streptomyces sp. NPDC058579]|uniref:FG-GAP repeat domain-containing protein n=1 Tax=Streptomyces sp. NPDC058579 TaxID=3346548 RepID=UPI0036514266